MSFAVSSCQVARCSVVIQRIVASKAGAVFICDPVDSPNIYCKATNLIQPTPAIYCAPLRGEGFSSNAGPGIFFIPG